MTIALEEKITQHATYVNLENILQSLEEIDSNGLPTDQSQMLGRIRETFIFLKEALDKVDPWLISTTTLTNMNQPISQIVNELNNFKSNKNDQHLKNTINNHIEKLLLYFSQVLVSRTPEDIEGVRASVISFRKSVGQHLSNVERDAIETSETLTSNTQKLNELTNSIEGQKSRIDSIISDIQKQFLQAQSQRNEEFGNFLKIGEEDFKGTVEANKNSFGQLILEQKESFGSLNEKFKEQIKTQQESFDTLTEDLKNKLGSELDEIKQMNQEAEKIVGIISMKGLAHGYQKIANEESKRALWWNLGSIGSMIAVIVFGVIFILMHEGTFDWTTLVSRIVLTGIGLTLFTYCAKQATNHRNEERRNRKIELELASLDPYLKDLDTQEQKEVKQKLVDKYFGVELPSTALQEKQGQAQQQNVVDTISNNPQLLQLLAERVNLLITKQ
ncbi:hypothetical protein [Rossellomorea aquimaris]|uniref:hypothetical protein n=1 Tax=Rossellomorea aquimaris TaxID=189382 RepID=UPI00249531B1|nr:hypothetical protein [Rossellomorea aquimaris]